jgi:alpha-1,6-mannosyltransferase
MRRLGGLGLLSLLLYGAGNVWQPPLPRSYQALYFLWFSALFVVYLAALLESRRAATADHPRVLILIVGGGLIFRASLLGVVPGFLSDDLYRYVWDGLVQQAGINPYRYPPEAAEMAFLRDDTVFPLINRKWAPTIYPPGAQLFFRAMAWLQPGSLLLMKGGILLADAATLCLLLALLKHLRADRARVLLYAWNPLVIVELGLSGHLDGLMIPMVLLAFWLSFKKRPWLAGLALGAATLVKLYPALLLPVLVRRRPWSLLIAWAALVAAGYGLFLDAGWRVLGYLPRYATPYEFYNLSLRPLLTWLLGRIVEAPYRYVQALGAVVLLVAMAWAWRHRAPAELSAMRRGMALIALYLLAVSPSVFPWYLLWLLALATAAPTGLTPAWVYWSWSVNVDYLETLFGGDSPVLWLRLLEYLPLYLWLIGSCWWARLKLWPVVDLLPRWREKDSTEAL